MSYITFADAARTAAIRLRAQNFIGAEVSARAMQRLAERDTQRWIADEILEAAERMDVSQASCLWYVEKVTMDVGLDMEMAAWERAHDEERTMRSEQIAEHWDFPDYIWQVPANYQFSRLPAYLMAHKYPRVEGNWEWPYGDFASTQEWFQAIADDYNSIPF